MNEFIIIGILLVVIGVVQSFQSNKYNAIFVILCGLVLIVFALNKNYFPLAIGIAAIYASVRLISILKSKRKVVKNKKILFLILFVSLVTLFGFEIKVYFFNLKDVKDQIEDERKKEFIELSVPDLFGVYDNRFLNNDHFKPLEELTGKNRRKRIMGMEIDK